MSLRINEIINEIKFRTLADIGTDHAYIPIFAKLSGKIDKAIACDLNLKPLIRAEKNILKYNMSEFIECRLGSGISQVSINDAEVITIAGMGGTLIIDILKQRGKIEDNVKQLILQPQSDAYDVRKYICEIGFKIENETMIKEAGKFYNIINCLRGYEQYCEKEYMFGKKLIQKKCSTLKELVCTELNKLKNIILKLESKNIINKRYEELNQLKIMYEEILLCL